MENGLSLPEELGTLSPIIAFQRILLNPPNYDHHQKKSLTLQTKLSRCLIAVLAVHTLSRECIHD